MLKDALPSLCLKDAVDEIDKSFEVLSRIVNHPKLFINDYFSELRFQVDVDTEEFLVGLQQHQDLIEADQQRLLTSHLESCIINHRRQLMLNELGEHEKLLQGRLSSDQVLLELARFKCKYDELRGQANEIIARESFSHLMELKEKVVYEINQATRLLLNDQSFVFIERETINKFESYFPAKTFAKKWPYQGVLLNFKKLILEKENFV